MVLVFNAQQHLPVLLRVLVFSTPFQATFGTDSPSDNPAKAAKPPCCTQGWS
jgi:hypothetical protein